MTKLRYRRGYKTSVVLILLGFLLFAFWFVYSVASVIQYKNLVRDMKPIEATIIEIDDETRYKGPDEQEIYITYEVDGTIYNRKLKTDTKVSLSVGTGAHYSVSDKISIFYNPQSPDVIATSRSVGVGIFYAVIAFVGLVPTTYVLVHTLKNSRKNLITEEEYEEEKERLERIKLREIRLEKKRQEKEINTKSGKNTKKADKSQ